MAKTPGRRTETMAFQLMAFTFLFDDLLLTLRENQGQGEQMEKKRTQKVNRRHRKVIEKERKGKGGIKDNIWSQCGPDIHYECRSEWPVPGCDTRVEPGSLSCDRPDCCCQQCNTNLSKLHLNTAVFHTKG